jgi:transketolase
VSKCQSRVELDGLRKNILEAAFKAQEGHIPSAFSILEIVYGFYNRFHKEQLMIEGKKHHFILSKGHGSLALYAVLSHFGIISEDWKYTFASASSEYGGHPDSNKITGVEVSSGSLGHGLPIALGIALGKRIKKEDGRVYVLVGDGEINEGSNWESFLLLGKFNLRNLVVVVDCNDSGERALPLGSLSKKLEGFN